jgi:hypothetical protein
MLTNNWIQNLITMLKFILSENYFQFNQNFYRQVNGLGMGAPTPALLARVPQHNYVLHIPREQPILGYFRYVNDVLII